MKYKTFKTYQKINKKNMKSFGFAYSNSKNSYPVQSAVNKVIKNNNKIIII